MKLNNNRNLADKWFEIGESDFQFAKINMKNLAGFYSQICFYFQQAVEKYLKGFLVFHGKRFPKIHDLIQLLKLCAKVNKDFLDYLEEVNYLSQFYLIARYPFVEYPPAGMTEAREAKRCAANVIDFIKKEVELDNKKASQGDKTQ